MRTLSTTTLVCLPRQGRPRPPPPPTLPAASTSTSTSSLAGGSATPTATTAQASSEVPWFLQEEEDVEVLHAATPVSAQQRNALDEDLPEPLSTLHHILTQGERSSLIARPDEEGGLDSVTGKKPIRYINAKELDEEAWADWIVVVQVKSNAGGSVSRVAREVGGFLKHALPPALQPSARRTEAEEEDEDEGAASIEDFLGQAKRESLRDRPSKDNASRQVTPAATTPPAEERGAWRPFKIISREAQDGIRILHSSDPEKWTRLMLAQTFKISPESVRRILRSKWQPTGKTIGRQNRRAMEREQERRAERGWMKKEVEEVALIRKEMEQNNEGVYEDEQEYRLQGDEEEGEEEGRHSYTQPVFYEGLVHSGEDRTQGRGKSPAGRGDGEWCLVDAGWCVVHVMTARARQTYDVESIAARAAAKRGENRHVSAAAA